MCASYNRRNTKIVRYRKTHFNIGTILFVMLLVYVIVVSVTYLQKERTLKRIFKVLHCCVISVVIPEPVIMYCVSHVVYIGL